MSNRPLLPSFAATGIALRFVADIQAGRRPSIEAALDQAPKDEWANLLQSLLIAETNSRRARGETPLAHEYLPRFPAHVEVVRSVVPEAVSVQTPAVELLRVLEPPPLPVHRSYPESLAVLVGPAPAVPMAILLPHDFENLEREPEPIAGRARRRRRLLVGGLAVIVAATITGLLFVRPARPKVIDPPPDPGAGGPVPKDTPKVTPKAAPTDPERDLAEWVLSIGGHGTVLPEGGSRRPLTADAPAPKGRFAVTAVVLPPEVAGRWKSDDLERLRGRDRLTSIELHAGGPLNEANLAPLAGLPFRSLKLDAPVAATGSFFASFADLETLILPNCPGFSDADLTAVGRLNKLSALTLNSPKLTVDGFKELRNPGLKSLSFGEDVVPTPDLVRLLQRLPLEEFESAAGMTDDAFVEFALFPELKRIRLRRTTLTDSSLRAVVGLGKLEEFRAEGSGIAGPGLEFVAERKGLKVLDLSGAKLTNDALGMLLALPALKELRLAGNAITDDGSILIAQLDGLEVLDLGETGITDATLRMLKKHPTLKTLIATNTRVTSPGVRDFEAGTPGCKVVFGRRR